jgi:hypothetical protein
LPEIAELHWELDQQSEARNALSQFMENRQRVNMKVIAELVVKRSEALAQYQFD